RYCRTRRRNFRCSCRLAECMTAFDAAVLVQHVFVDHVTKGRASDAPRRTALQHGQYTSSEATGHCVYRVSRWALGYADVRTRKDKRDAAADTGGSTHGAADLFYRSCGFRYVRTDSEGRVAPGLKAPARDRPPRRPAPRIWVHSSQHSRE